MEKDLTFDELTHLVGATVISCDFDGNAVEEYVIEEYDSEHGRISVSKRIDNHVTSIWPEELYLWHFRFPGSSGTCLLRSKLITSSCLRRHQ